MVRQLWLDRLRLLGTFTVVWLHTSAHVVIYGQGSAWWVGNAFDTIANWAVPAFVMITGALLLGQPLKTSPLDFYRQRLGRILIPLVAWTCFYVVWGAFRQQHFDLGETVQNILNGVPYYHLWYIYMLVGLYLVAPFINYMVANIPRAWVGTALMVFFGINIAIHYAGLLGIEAGGMFLDRYTYFLGYFLAGHYFATTPKPLFDRRTALIIFLVCSLAVTVISGLLVSSSDIDLLSYTYTSLNPLMILMTFSMFALFQNTRTDDVSGAKWLRRFSLLSIGIYLIHPFWLEVILQFFPHQILQFPLISIPLYAILAFALSALSCQLMAAVRVLKRVFL